MKPGGPDESRVSRQNAPFRDLHKTGHDLNHTFKNPVAQATNIGGMNLSYMHPHDHGSGPTPENAPKAFAKANVIKPMSQMGTGKT